MFESVLGWILTPFEIQNILFDLKVYEPGSLPKDEWDNWEGLREYEQMALEANASFAVLDPSVGLGGVTLFTGPNPLKT